MRRAELMGNNYLFAQFCCESKTARKIRSVFKKTKLQRKELISKANMTSWLLLWMSWLPLSSYHKLESHFLSCIFAQSKPHMNWFVQILPTFPFWSSTWSQTMEVIKSFSQNQLIQKDSFYIYSHSIRINSNYPNSIKIKIYF